MSGLSSYDLKQLAHAHMRGQRAGIFSVCSAHPWVLEAAMRRMAHAPGPLLIEATCNQVNQFGGYTGLTPRGFRAFVEQIAARVSFPLHRILLGGDHLGPYPWRHLPAAQAMAHACDLVTAFVDAGFTKIHLDASMACGGDPVALPPATVAQRAATLARAAEAAAQGHPLRYVVGTEVPTPGGSVEELAVTVTRPADAEESLELHRLAFASAGLDRAWDNVMALVTQPGVEFGHESVVDYDRAKARALTGVLDKHPELVFEAHSTDYQLPLAYQDLVADGFCVLKVGPALTYAMRQAIFALLRIEHALIPDDQCSRLEEVLLTAMQQDPVHWKEHYTGSPREVRRMLVHSYSDRIRYYWNVPSVQAALSRLIENLTANAIPETLLSDYLPGQYLRTREHLLAPAPVALVLDKIIEALGPYVAACAPSA